MSTDDILDQIDHAVRDYEMSPDAMRWSPEKPEPPAFPGGRSARIEWNHARIDRLTIDWAQIGAEMSVLQEDIDWAQIGAEMSVLQEAMVELVRAGELFLYRDGALVRPELSHPPGMVPGGRGEAVVRQTWQDEVWTYREGIWNVMTSSSSDDSDH